MREKLLVLAASAFIFLLKFDIRALDVTNIDWIYRLSFDPGTEILSWQYFRISPWSFPIIGQMEGYEFPTVTGAGMTGIVPPLAIPMKILSPILPDTFQYFGGWFLLCYVLQGWFGLKLLRGLAENYDLKITSNQYALSAIFFTIAPPLLTRTGHIHMCSQFLILAAFYTYFRTADVGKKMKHFFVIVGIMAMIHQYMTVMVLGIALAAMIDLWQRGHLSFPKLMLLGLGFLVEVGFIFYILGDFLIPFVATQAEGFGKYSSNLNTFFNADGDGSFLPKLKILDGQYEGKAYLGLGFILLLLTTFFYNLSSKTTKILRGASVENKEISGDKNAKMGLYPLVFVVTLFFIYALSCNVAWGDKVLFRWKPGPLFSLFSGSLRASGRFIWVAFYLIFALGFVGFYKISLSNWSKTCLLSLFLLIQFRDLQPLIAANETDYKPCKKDCAYEKWKPIFNECEKVTMFPTNGWNYKDYSDFYTFAQAAVSQKKSINTGYFARNDDKLMGEYEEKMKENFKNGNLEGHEKDVFVGPLKKINRFKTLFDKGMVKAFNFNGYAVLVPKSLTKTLAYLSQQPNCPAIDFGTEESSF